VYNVIRDWRKTIEYYQGYIRVGVYIMIVTKELTPGAKPTPEQIEMIEKAKKMPIVFDEDSPALTPKAAEGFRVAARERNRRRHERETV
jgi:hypothetical protein